MLGSSALCYAIICFMMLPHAILNYYMQYPLYIMVLYVIMCMVGAYGVGGRVGVITHQPAAFGLGT